MDTILDCWHRRTSFIELDKLLAARKVTFKPLQSHVTDTIALQIGKKICRKLWKDLGRHQPFVLADCRSNIIYQINKRV